VDLEVGRQIANPPIRYQAWLFGGSAAVPVEGAAPEAEASFDSFVLATRSKLVGQAYAFTGDLGSAQDLVQEAYIKAWRNWENLQRYQNREAWVRRVLYNLAVSGWRKARRRRISEQRRWLEQPRAVEFDPNTQHQELAQALHSLPEQQQRVLVLHHVAGLRISEVAEELGLPEGTVKSSLSRGRASLAARISTSSEPAVRGE
jgi:RNA polymerase sigma-70 factor, ECF subfamily